MDIKKGTVSLYRTLCRKKVRLPLIKWSVFLALEHRPTLGKRQDFPYSTEAFLARKTRPALREQARLPLIKPSNYRLAYVLYPRQSLINSPQLAGTTDSVD